MTAPKTDTTTHSYTLADFDYPLPEALIAKYPLPHRDQSRMMVLDRKVQAFRHDSFKNLSQWLSAGDLVVVNNAKVIPVRLQGHRAGYTGHVEIFLMHPENMDRTCWQVLMRPARRLKPGTIIHFQDAGLSVEAMVLENLGDGKGLVSLSWPDTLSFEAMLEQIGTLPIPPYLERPPEALDNERYQTVFAKAAGAQAAPTAGLHFTQQTFQDLAAKGIGVAEVTLQVSAGTFRPVLSDNIQDHRMDPEWYTLPQETVTAIQAAKSAGKRVIAVGTTVAKTLETCAQRHQGQLHAEFAWSDLFIQPGFSFQVVDGLLTNFHLPKSTLLMLVSAFASRKLILDVYHAAIENRYRFYSYGDCMLIL